MSITTLENIEHLIMDNLEVIFINKHIFFCSNSVVYSFQRIIFSVSLIRVPWMAFIPPKIWQHIKWRSIVHQPYGSLYVFRIFLIQPDAFWQIYVPCDRTFLNHRCHQESWTEQEFYTEKINDRGRGPSFIVCFRMICTTYHRWSVGPRYLLDRTTKWAN